jgi:putative endonuclease
MNTREEGSRRLPQLHGRQAETIVSELLAARGYTILAHNLRLGHRELDIVARRGAVLTAFEVRFRSATSWQSSLGSIGTTKRRHLQSALRSLWARVRRDPTIERVKLEIAAVTFSSDEIHVEIVPAPLA